MKITVIITVKSRDGQHIRDTRKATATDLVNALNSYLSRGFELVAIEELEKSILDFYSKRMTEADLDAMALNADVPE